MRWGIAAARLSTLWSGCGVISDVEVVSVFVACIALVLSGISLRFSVKQHRREEARSHRKSRPVISGLWRDDGGLTLTLDEGYEADYGEASVHLPHAWFVEIDADARRTPTMMREEPWPLGYNWVLPPIDVGDQVKKLKVVVTVSPSKGRPWDVTLSLDPPTKKRDLFVY